MAEKLQKEVKNFDSSSLKHAETTEKNILPSPEGFFL